MLKLLTMNLLKKLSLIKLEILLFIVLALLLHKVDFSIDKDSEFYFKKADIYYEYEFAKQIQKGENPYDPILESNMLENDKYATQLPLYFYFLVAIKNLSGNNLSGFIEYLRSVLFYFHLGGGVLIYAIFRKHSARLLGLFAAVLYMFNVWTLNSFIYLKQDIVAIALLLAALYFFDHKKNSWASYVFFALSLGIKHIGIFIFPLFLLPLIFKRTSAKNFGINIALFLAMLILPVLPFIADNFDSFWKSMLFSLTRAPFSSDIIFGYSELLIEYSIANNHGTVFQQMLPRLPLFIMYAFLVFLLFSKKILKFTFVFLALVVFAIFNPVIFPQYITWLPPFALLPLLDNHPRE